MRRSCLAALRSADGRSLARALACLLVLSGWLGALHAGSMTALAAGGAVTCSAGAALADGSVPAIPASRDHYVCCLLGCAAAGAGIAAGGVAEAEFDPPDDDAARPGHAVVAGVATRAPVAGPRGPPLLA